MYAFTLQLIKSCYTGTYTQSPGVPLCQRQDAETACIPVISKVTCPTQGTYSLVIPYQSVKPDSTVHKLNST